MLNKNLISRHFKETAPIIGSELNEVIKELDVNVKTKEILDGLFISFCRKEPSRLSQYFFQNLFNNIKTLDGAIRMYMYLIRYGKQIIKEEYWYVFANRLEKLFNEKIEQLKRSKK